VIEVGRLGHQGDRRHHTVERRVDRDVQPMPAATVRVYELAEHLAVLAELIGPQKTLPDRGPAQQTDPRRQRHLDLDGGATTPAGPTGHPVGRRARRPGDLPGTHRRHRGQQDGATGTAIPFSLIDEIEQQHRERLVRRHVDPHRRDVGRHPDLRVQRVRGDHQLGTVGNRGGVQLTRFGNPQPLGGASTTAALRW
jgi:hypothetical protein